MVGEGRASKRTIPNDENSIHSLLILLREIFRDSLSYLVGRPPIHSIRSSWSNLVRFKNFCSLCIYALHGDFLPSCPRITLTLSLNTLISRNVTLWLDLVLYMDIQSR